MGGSVLGRGCVQEEIQFMLCPELICSRLFTEVLDDDECLLAIGFDRYNEYLGYKSSFKWAGDYVDLTTFDSFNRRKRAIVVIDAVPFKFKVDQFEEYAIRRELNKVIWLLNKQCFEWKNKII